ncbi:MAG: flagellar protein FlaG [Thermochromatium sp.]
MASDLLGVSTAIHPLQSTGSGGARTSPSSESRANSLPSSGNRTDVIQGQAARSTHRPESGQSARTDETRTDPSQGVAATDTEMVERLTDAVDKINEMMQQGKQMLTFQLDEESGRMVIRVIDAQTNEVIRQIPSEETLNFAKYVDGLIGLIFNKKA